MIIVDSSVWIDYFRGTENWQTDILDDLLGEEHVTVGDLILTEVLQGFSKEKDFANAHDHLMNLDQVALGGQLVAIDAARNYRVLRQYGITIRKTIDTLIATYCILHNATLLHNDRDFEPFANYLGLRCFD